MIKPIEPRRFETSDPVLDSIESMQKTIDSLRHRLESLPHRKPVEEKHGVRGFIDNHPFASITIVILTSLVIILALYLLLRRRR